MNRHESVFNYNINNEDEDVNENNTVSNTTNNILLVDILLQHYLYHIQLDYIINLSLQQHYQ
jgi:hypothetical protein